MFLRILRRLIVAVLILFVAVEALLWLFVRLPAEPPLRVTLTNDLPGMKRDVQLELFTWNVRRAGGSGSRAADGAVRVLCLGGASTFGMLQNADDTWWGRLRSGLEEAGIPAEVVAWGQEGAGIAASAAMADALADEYAPDVIVAMFGYDDVLGGYDPERKTVTSPPRRLSGWKRALLSVSQSARALRWWRVRNQAAAIQNVGGRPQAVAQALDEARRRVGSLPVLDGPPPPGEGDPLHAFVDGWKALHDVAERHGAGLVMAGEPSLHDEVAAAQFSDRMTALLVFGVPDPDQGTVRTAIRPSSGWIRSEMARYAAAAESFAAEHRHPWIDLNGRISRDTDQFLGDAVLTDAGAGAAAGLLQPLVEPLAREAAAH